MSFFRRGLFDLRAKHRDASSACCPVDERRVKLFDKTSGIRHNSPLVVCSIRQYDPGQRRRAPVETFSTSSVSALAGIKKELRGPGFARRRRGWNRRHRLWQPFLSPRTAKYTTVTGISAELKQIRDRWRNTVTYRQRNRRHHPNRRGGGDPLPLGRIRIPSGLVIHTRVKRGCAGT